MLFLYHRCRMLCTCQTHGAKRKNTQLRSSFEVCLNRFVSFPQCWLLVLLTCLLKDSQQSDCTPTLFSLRASFQYAFIVFFLSYSILSFLFMTVAFQALFCSILYSSGQPCRTLKFLWSTMTVIGHSGGQFLRSNLHFRCLSRCAQKYTVCCMSWQLQSSKS